MSTNNNGTVTSDYLNVLPPKFVLDYEKLAREIIKQQNIRQSTGNRSNVTDTVTTAHSASLSTSTSQDVSQATNLMETQLNSPATCPPVQTTETNLNTNIHQLVDKIVIQDNNGSPAHVNQVDPKRIYRKISLWGHMWDIK